MGRDTSLRSGERLVGETIDDIAAIDTQHVKRYAMVCETMGPTAHVIDIGCGCGYGTSMLYAASDRVIGIDDSMQAIEFARNKRLAQKNDH